jgi:hypothetical protein
MESYLDSNGTKYLIEKIVDGTLRAGSALIAKQDEEGNAIVETYIKKIDIVNISDEEIDSLFD